MLRSPVECAMTTTGRPATIPAKLTVPAAGAQTWLPSATARSTPRWPAPQRDCGGSKRRLTRCGAGTGQTRSAAGAPTRDAVLRENIVAASADWTGTANDTSPSTSTGMPRSHVEKEFTRLLQAIMSISASRAHCSCGRRVSATRAGDNPNAGGQPEPTVTIRRHTARQSAPAEGRQPLGCLGEHLVAFAEGEANQRATCVGIVVEHRHGDPDDPHSLG